MERRRRVATLVLRPVDAFREALQRPVFERGPVQPVRFRILGEVVGGALSPMAGGPPAPVRNVSGDTVFRDLALPAGTYRIGLARDPRRRADAYYEEVDPAERDLAWDPAAPGAGLPGLPTHPSRLEPLRLYPTASYPFPTATTLVRGSLHWYDGTALAGAVVREPAAIVSRSRVHAGGELGLTGGDFVLAFRATAATGNANLQLDLAAVDPAARPDGAAYLGGWPGQWPAQWERGTTRTVRQGALAGTVLRDDGRVLPGATVRLAGRPGPLRTSAEGRWSYHFPPLTAAGTVNITVQHPDYPDATVNNVAFPADATAAAPTVVMS